MPPIPTTYIWADYFSLWICGEKTWCLHYNHPSTTTLQQLSSLNYMVPLDHDIALGIVRRPMSKETVERARKALCKTKEGRDAFAHIESMFTECGYDDIFWDVVWGTIIHSRALLQRPMRSARGSRFRHGLSSV